MYPREPSGKRCFAYCGDDICDCDAHPRFSRFRFSRLKSPPSGGLDAGHMEQPPMGDIPQDGTGVQDRVEPPAPPATEPVVEAEAAEVEEEAAEESVEEETEEDPD